MAKAAPVLQKVSQAYTAGKESALAFLLNVATHDITDRRFLSIVKKYVMRSSSPEEGLEEMKKLLKEKDLEIAKLKAQNVTDELTRVMNRHGLFEKGIPLVALSQRSAKTVAAIAIDLDNFKVVNDLFGHDVGDDVLKRVSQIVNEQIRRKSDLVVRMGGEEFVVLLPESSSKGALPLAEAIRKAVESDKVLQALLSKHSDDLLKNLSSEPYEKALAFTKASFGREIPEELTSVMAHINKSAQNSVKERLEDKAALIEILRKNTPKNQTISVGVSSLDALATYEPKQFIKDLIALADVGLRDAKKLGKNQVVIHNH